MNKEIIESTVQEALQMHTDGKPSGMILSHLVRGAEKFARDTVSSILLLDNEGLLRNGASPQLPSDYLKAIDGIKPHPKLGTCASAAATGNMVITTDFRADDKWAELKHLPLALGFLGAWSMPIITEGGKVLGTFGTYFRVTRKPSQDEIDAVKELSLTAARILEKKN